MAGGNKSHKTKHRERKGEWLYARAQPWAYGAKVLLQMAIGASAVAGLLAVLFLGYDASAFFKPTNAPPLLADRFLAIVGSALVLAAGVELAHTLFTDGPDEAVDPLILGMSAALLLQLADVKTFDQGQGVAALLYTAALLLLFGVRQYFFDDDVADNDPPG
jgi:hypothetical protein